MNQNGVAAFMVVRENCWRSDLGRRRGAGSGRRSGMRVPTAGQERTIPRDQLGHTPPPIAA